MSWYLVKYKDSFTFTLHIRERLIDKTKRRCGDSIETDLKEVGVLI
jgi:hypothetical protein